MFSAYYDKSIDDYAAGVLAYLIFVGKGKSYPRKVPTDHVNEDIYESLREQVSYKEKINRFVEN